MMISTLCGNTNSAFNDGVKFVLAVSEPLVYIFSAGIFRCYTHTDCTGTVIEASNQRDCCVGTNDGLSYGDGDTCNPCTGKA